jgi:hypothetical protein
MKLINPLSTDREPTIYGPEEATDFLLNGDRVAYIFPLGIYNGDDLVSVDWAEDFSWELDERTTNHRFLVGTWESAFWGAYSLPDSEKVETIAEEMGLRIADTGPIAYYEEDDKRLFPLQPTDGIFAVSKDKTD